ncbi:hypothetical protein GA0115260_109664 [Streptomyces sp. MnatMP-M27]|nr:hypothetical protein GA0115260_109664 [Streptomyces sp. MnatMP-M27]
MNLRRMSSQCRSILTTNRRLIANHSGLRADCAVTVEA